MIPTERADEDSKLAPGKYGPWQAAALAVLAAVAFGLLATPRLTAQGPYQDELHQAVGAFCYLGSPPEFGINLEIGGFPVLSTSYSGALKTAIYGLYLRFVEPRFSLFSWRLLGIVLVAASLGLFVWMVRKALRPTSLAIFLALLLTDATVLLTVRHDWGPVALALALRLMFAALWLSGEAARGAVSPGNSFALGCVAGIAVFEKLSSVVLLWPLALILAATPNRRRPSHWLSATAGMAAGLLPLFLSNWHSWAEKGWLSSLESVAAEKPPETLDSLVNYSLHYLQMGSGSALRGFILGGSRHWTDSWEWLIIPILGVALMLLVLRAREGEPDLRQAGIALASYVGLAVAFKLIPRPTWIHHWIQGTPWQYLTLALVAGRLRWGAGGAQKALTAGLAAILAVWLPIRVAGLVHLEKELFRGKASDAWSPEIAVLGDFAAGKCGQARFIDLTWGLAYPIYAYSNGCPEIVRELYWDYQGPDHLREIVTSSPWSEIYLVGRRIGRAVNAENATRIEEDLRALPEWREVPPPPEIASLTTIRVVRFVPDSQ